MLTLKRSPLQCRLDEAVERFELALAHDRATRLADHLDGLSPASDADRRIASELFCVDLEYRWQQGQRVSLADYGEEFASWLSCPNVKEELSAACQHLLHEGQSRETKKKVTSPGDSTRESVQGTTSTHVGHGVTDTDVAFPERDMTRLVDIAETFPAVGERFGAFRLDEELGRGAFAVAFRARQLDLDGRAVVLKISAAADLESRYLARLQHTHIVPVYSCHRHQGWQAICMPYVGRETLEQRLRSQGPQGDGFSEIESLRIIRQLADGLRHAHARGILHRDLKPANVLLGDDQLARLLDFNLSQDVLSGGAACAVVGGTLPYLAPEHLESVLTGATLDARCDIYSLGVIWFQMLAGRLPFPHRRGPLVDLIRQMIADRLDVDGEWREAIPRVSCAVRSILDRMLAGDIARRYRSMDEVCDDLDRQLANRPLRHAPNASRRELFSKWCRRHPRWSSASTVIALSSLLVGALVATLAVHQRRLEHEQSLGQLRSAQSQLPALRALISDPVPDRSTRQRARTLARQIADQYHLLSDFDWGRSPLARRLTGTDREELQQLIAEDLYALMACELRECELAESPSERMEALAESERLVQRSQQLIPANQPVHTAVQEQAKIVEELRAAPESPLDPQKSLTRRSRGVMDGPAAQRELLLSKFQSRDYESLVGRLESERARNPQDVSTMVLLGNAYVGLARWDEAELAYTSVIAWLPDADWAWFYRGLCRVQMGQTRHAIADFTRAIELNPLFVSAWVNRAVARRDLQEWPAAEDDLHQALKLDDSQSRLYLLRAEVRRHLNNRAGAQEDQQRGLALEPHDEQGYVQRGLAWLALKQFDHAQRDFERALRFEAHSHAAWRNLAHLYAERLGEPEQALQIISNLITWHHAQPQDVVSRGVLYARLGRYEEAMADARQLARQTLDAKTMFQIGCIHALCAVHRPEEASLATAWIERAITSDGRWWEVAQRDSDLEAVRANEPFGHMLQLTQEQLKQRAMIERDATVDHQE